MRKQAAALIMALMLMCAWGMGMAESRPLLYLVEDAEGHRIYLLGTIHVAGESTYPLSEAVENAYAEAEVLAVEVDLYAYANDPGLALRYAALLAYPPEDSAKNHLSEETYALGVEKLGESELVLNRMRTAGWLSLAARYAYDQAGLSPETGVDLHLLTRAHQDGKAIDELEGIESQIEVLLALPDSVVEEQLVQYLENPALCGASIRMMLTAWEQGAEGTLRVFVAQDASLPTADADRQDYQDTLYHDRDDGFFTAAEGYLREGRTALIAVGAAHVIGAGGLKDQFTAAGYTVTEIGR